MPHQALLLLAVEPEERRLRVRVTLEDPSANPPLDRGFFVRMLITLAGEVGGNAHIDAAVQAHHSGPGYESAFIDPNAWRFVSGYDELLCPEDPQTQETRVFEYEVSVVDAAWLDALSPGLECDDSADFSSGADPVTPEEAALVPDIRVGEVLAPFEDRGLGCVAISSDSTLIALMPEMGAVVVVFDSETLQEVLRHPAPLAWECTFVPGSTMLVFDADMPAIDVRTGETIPRTEAVHCWVPPKTTALPWRAISKDGGVRVLEEELKGRRIHRIVDDEWQTLRLIKRAQEPRVTSPLPLGDARRRREAESAQAASRKRWAGALTGRSLRDHHGGPLPTHLSAPLERRQVHSPWSLVARPRRVRPVPSSMVTGRHVRRYGLSRSTPRRARPCRGVSPLDDVALRHGAGPTSRRVRTLNSTATNRAKNEADRSRLRSWGSGWHCSSRSSPAPATGAKPTHPPWRDPLTLSPQPRQLRLGQGYGVRMVGWSCAREAPPAGWS
ncbi:MAG: hypothetical protein AB8H86_03280 [Polyangiales bacterium]